MVNFKPLDKVKAKPKHYSQQEIIKNYERSDEIQNKKYTIKINKARTLFFENLNKICKRLAQLTNRKMNMTQIKKLKIKSCPSNCNIAPQWRKLPERGMTQLGWPMKQKKLPEK